MLREWLVLYGHRMMPAEPVSFFQRGVISISAFTSRHIGTRTYVLSPRSHLCVHANMMITAPLGCDKQVGRYFPFFVTLPPGDTSLGSFKVAIICPIIIFIIFPIIWKCVINEIDNQTLNAIFWSE
jgi:hypothetical protein